MNENIQFFTEGYARFRTLEMFKQSWTYRYLESLFGELVMVFNDEYKFIGVDNSGYFYNEIYYPKKHQNAYSLVPRSFVRNQFRPKVSDLWKEVDEKGYAVIPKYEVEQFLKHKVMTEQYSEQLDDTMLLPWYVDRFDYDAPERSWNPNYLNQITDKMMKDLDLFSGVYIKNTDSIKYIYKEDHQGDAGPYSYHMDYMPRLYCMLFNYYSSKPQINGRELLVGTRDLSSFDFQNPLIDRKALCKDIIPNAITTCNRININPEMIILMNSINPVFVHVVDKLKSDNQVILLTNYIWV